MMIADKRISDDWQEIAREVFDKLISLKFGDCSGITDCKIKIYCQNGLVDLHYFMDDRRGAVCRAHHLWRERIYLGEIVLRDHRTHRSKPTKVETPVC